MSHCLTLSRRCVEYCPISLSNGFCAKVIIWLDPCVDYRSPSDVERCPVRQSRWLACACREYVYIHSKLSPFDIYMLQRGSRTQPCNKDTRGLLAARQKPPWYMSSWGKEVSVGNAALRRDSSSWWSCPLRQKKTLACLQLLWCPAWPPVMGWIWSSFKNVVPFFT